MSQNELILTADRMRFLLGELSKELAARGKQANIYVVGGANIALSVDGSRTTNDIDAVIEQGRRDVAEAAAAVAERVDGLGPDWINTEFMGEDAAGGITWQWFDNRDEDTPSTLFASESLNVQLASPEMMLALKSLANRDQDLADTYKLMRKTGIRTPEEIGRNIARFTGPRIFRAQGRPGMFLRIDPKFSRIFDNAPDDLKPPANVPRKERPQCSTVRVTTRAGVKVSEARCRRKEGHWGPHRFW